MPFDKSSRPSRSYLKHAPLVLAASALVLVQASHAEAPSAGAALKPAAQIVLRTDEAAAGAKPAAQSAQKSPAASDYVEREEVQKYLRSLAKEKKIPYEWLEREVALARYSPLSEKYTTPKPKADKKTTPEKNFLLYERNLVNTERIVKGVDFIERNADTLRRVEAETGVSGYAVTAIIGVESIYGRNMGRFRVLDALMTLSFDYTRRAKYYRSELAKALDADSAKGKSISDIFSEMITDKDGKQKTGIFVDQQQKQTQQNAARFTKPSSKEHHQEGQKYTMAELMKMKNENPGLDIKQYM